LRKPGYDVFVESASEQPERQILELAGLFMNDFNSQLRSTLEASRERGAATARSTRTSRIRVLALIPQKGVRISELAERAGMTKQAMGEIAAGLEASGLLLTAPDPADRRAKLVRLTRKGQEVVSAANTAIRRTEAQWRERLGERRWNEFRQILVDLHELAVTAEPSAT
jgi:DNA-binding MarR family transcriptional regulator